MGDFDEWANCGDKWLGFLQEARKMSIFKRYFP